VKEKGPKKSLVKKNFHQKKCKIFSKYFLSNKDQRKTCFFHFSVVEKFSQIKLSQSVEISFSIFFWERIFSKTRKKKTEIYFFVEISQSKTSQLNTQSQSIMKSSSKPLYP